MICRRPHSRRVLEHDTVLITPGPKTCPPPPARGPTWVGAGVDVHASGLTLGSSELKRGRGCFGLELQRLGGIRLVSRGKVTGALCWVLALPAVLPGVVLLLMINGLPGQKSPPASTAEPAPCQRSPWKTLPAPHPHPAVPQPPPGLRILSKPAPHTATALRRVLLRLSAGPAAQRTRAPNVGSRAGRHQYTRQQCVSCSEQ